MRKIGLSSDSMFSAFLVIQSFWTSRRLLCKALAGEYPLQTAFFQIHICWPVAVSYFLGEDIPKRKFVEKNRAKLRAFQGCSPRAAKTPKTKREKRKM